MDVIIVGDKSDNKNPFFEEITRITKRNFHYQTWENIRPKKKQPILFQWPEFIFAWKEPSSEKLKQFEEKVGEWKKDTKLLYIVHNEERHLGMTPNFRKLYDIVENSADVMIHFGNYSKEKFSQQFPEKLHLIIRHPLYEDSYKKLRRLEARKKLNIQESRFVLLAPGKIRNNEQRKLIFKAFNFLPTKNKSLIIPQMSWKRSRIEFKGRYFLKPIVDIKKLHEKLINNYSPPNYFFHYGYCSPEEFSLFIASADGILIPRANILNSGGVYLGLTAKKVMVGPAAGNVKEILEKFNFPVFDPNEVGSLENAMCDFYKLAKNPVKENDIKLKQYKPEVIAREWDVFLDSLFVPFQN